MEIKKYVPWWLSGGWLLHFWLPVAGLVFFYSRTWVPFGQNFTIIDGELVVRHAYFTARYYSGLFLVVFGTAFVAAHVLQCHYPKFFQKMWGKKYARSYVSTLSVVAFFQQCFFVPYRSGAWGPVLNSKRKSYPSGRVH